MRQEAVQVKKLKLSDARANLGLTQRALATRAGVSPMVVSNAENGIAIRRLSAHALVNALNSVRREQGLEELSLYEIELSIAGE